MAELSSPALDYHSFPTPGKLSIALSKRTQTPEDLSLAYTPGVAEPVNAIAADPEAAYRYTSKGNLVAVISDGSAILGLGNLGGLASKPVMEGKAVLFKCFADIDVFDIELGTQDPTALIETIANIAPTFGGINLEDIKAPQCFEVEKALIERLDIPVFHDDQHGTAVVVAAALLNALMLQGKRLETVKIVCLGAGAAGIATMRLLKHLGAKPEQIFMVDSQGVIHRDRSDLNVYKAAFAQQTPHRTLADVLKGADVLIGVSGPQLVNDSMLLSMAAKPIVFALSNPTPEISPELAHGLRTDLIMATGRSDYPNQVNNVLAFPYIFRGALEVRARCINSEMLIAAVEAIRLLAHEVVPDNVKVLYPGQTLAFGPNYILPKPFDKRLLKQVSEAVSRAAIQTGVARVTQPELSLQD